MSRPLDMSHIGMIYAGAQKNIGPAGVCMVIIRQDLLDLVPDHIPTMLSYATFANKNSMFNTPPCFGIYTIQLVMKWLEETIGGLKGHRSVGGCRASIYNATGIDAINDLISFMFFMADY